MSVITISRQTFTGGEVLGKHLAEELSYRYVTREDLFAEAETMGVPVHLLLDAFRKPPGAVEKVLGERDRYVSCVTMLLCEKALQENIVYNGHAGHMLLLGIPHLLRVNVVADMEYRLDAVRTKYTCNRAEAQDYIRRVDEDRDRWVRFLYVVDWHGPFNYDLTVNLGQAALEQAASAVLSMANLTQYQFTDYSVRSLKNLYLAAKAHYHLASDERTKRALFSVNADDGVVQVTGQPRSAEALDRVPEVLQAHDDIREVHVTVALDTVLYVGERFDPNSDGFQSTVNIARRRQWAVELVTMPAALSEVELKGEEKIAPDVSGDFVMERSPVKQDDQSIGVPRCLEVLRDAGCSGGSNHFYDTPRSLVRAMQRRTDCKLLIIGTLFAQKADLVRNRMRLELEQLLEDNLRFPVVLAEELEEYYAVRRPHMIRMGLWLLPAVVLFGLLFIFKDAVMELASAPEPFWRKVVSVLIIATLTPVFAISYGTFVRHVLRWVRLD